MREVFAFVFCVVVVTLAVIAFTVLWALDWVLLKVDPKYGAVISGPKPGVDGL